MSNREYQVLVYIGAFSNAYLFDVGVYQLRASLTYQRAGKTIFATPQQLWVADSDDGFAVRSPVAAQLSDKAFCSQGMLVYFERQTISAGAVCRFALKTIPKALGEFKLQVSLHFTPEKTPLGAFKEVSAREYSLSGDRLHFILASYEPEYHCHCDVLVVPLFVRHVGLTSSTLTANENIRSRCLDLVAPYQTSFSILLEGSMVSREWFFEQIEDMETLRTNENPREIVELTLALCSELSTQLVQTTDCFIKALIEERSKLLNKLRTTYVRKERQLYSQFVQEVEPGLSQKAKKRLARELKLAAEESGSVQLQGFTLKNMPVLLIEHSHVNSSQSCSYLPVRHKRHIVVLVHGYKAQPVSLFRIQSYLALHHANMELIAPAFERNTTIAAAGRHVATVVEELVSQFKGFQPSVSFIGYSLGGLVVRAALQHLSAYASMMHTYISLSTPHLGITSDTHWLMNFATSIYSVVSSAPELAEMKLKDADSVENSYLYQLSSASGLEWFANVVLIGCHNDSMVSYASATASVPEAKNSSEAAFQTMAENLIRRIPQLKRGFVVFPHKSLWRGSHTEYLRSAEFAKLLSYSFRNLV